MNNDILKEELRKETLYTIVPSKVNVEDLFYYITRELSFDKVLKLYILLRNAISTGNLGDEDDIFL